ncbi:MAG: FeoB-associated Cys-rich membrane protein [Lachnospiraceae bacterium]|nr:FeoB-associated Cys-rich membrane protein [Lachnospiraceae bacterium]
MLAWITGNLGTILITLLLLLIVTGIIRSMIKDKKQGKLTCGGNCAHCRMCASCKTSGTNTVPGK